MSKISEQELTEIMSKSEYVNRTAFRVFEDGDGYVTEYEGVELRASNAFLLDSRLTDVGAPQPRNLFLMEE